MSSHTAQPVSLAERLRIKREERMLSQTEAAEQIGVSRRIYQAWESGRITRPRPKLRRKVEEWLS